MKGCETMQRRITIEEFESTVNTIDEIEEPIIIKRNNKQDLVVISLEQYKKFHQDEIDEIRFEWTEHISSLI